MLPAVALGLAGLGAGVIDTALGAGTDAANLNLAKQNLAWQKKVQRTAWRREDNAVFRRSKDLERSGFSRTLATGAAASAGPVVKTDTPQRDKSFELDAALQSTMNLMTQKNDMHMTDIQKELVAEQILGQHYKNEHQLVMNNLATWDLLKTMESGMHSKSGGPAKKAFDVMSMLKRAVMPKSGGNFMYDFGKSLDNVKKKVEDKSAQLKQHLKIKRR